MGNERHCRGKLSRFLDIDVRATFLLEDALAVIAGSMLISLGVVLLSGGGLLTGGVVGVAFFSIM